jgi:uncharacterized protein (TIGR03790 family)
MRLVVLLLGVACAPAAPETGDTAGEPVACELAESLRVEGDAIPGETVRLVAVDLDAAATIAWSVATGRLSAPSGASVDWTLPDDVAVDVSTTLPFSALASAPGCLDQALSGEVVVDWPERLRTLVIFNPEVPRSEEVARAYATFRGIPEERLCGVSSARDTTIDAAAYPAFVDAAKACIEAAGAHTTYVVPVWGVPYRVAGIISDISGGGTKATVSLDALLVYWWQARGMRQALWSPLWRTGDSKAGAYDPYVPIGEIRAEDDARYVLVSRIDGADADAALDLVERTRAAEAAVAGGTLDGVVYVDGNRGDTPPATDEFGSYESGEWNMWGTRRVFEADGRYEVVWDGNGAEFGTEPAPLWCEDALYYAGWYSYAHYNDAFEWTTGAIGGHLDSCSACDIRGTRDWSAMALRKGITGTFGAVSEPYVAGMPEYDQLFLYLLQGASYAEAGYEATRIGGWMMVFVGDPLYRPYGR